MTRPPGLALPAAAADPVITEGKKPCLLARSRGGLMLYAWAVEHPESVGGVAGIYPVCNLASYPGLGRACGAYGLTMDELKVGEFSRSSRFTRPATSL